MKNKILMGILISILIFHSCNQAVKNMNLSTPVDTLLSLQKNIALQDWKNCSKCFSVEIQKLNASDIQKKSFYLIDYWTKTRTTQALLGPLPIISKNASFQLEESSDNTALVIILYDSFVDKDMRIKTISLLKEGSDWKIAEVYERKEGLPK